MEEKNTNIVNDCQQETLLFQQPIMATPWVLTAQQGHKNHSLAVGEDGKNL